MSEIAPFWMVWRENGDVPRSKHGSTDKASAEAERLARRFPGETFFVLAPIASVAVVDTVRKTYIADPDAQIPF